MTTNNSQVETWWSDISVEDKLRLIRLDHDGYRALSKDLREAIAKVGGQTSTSEILGPDIFTLLADEWAWIRKQSQTG